MFVYQYQTYIIQELLKIEPMLFSDRNIIGAMCGILNTIEFNPVDEKDEILIGKGLDCRRLYFEQYGIWPREGPCMMFEMMVGLAMSCDEMLSPEPSETTPWMFFKYMLECIYSYSVNNKIAIGETEIDEEWIITSNIDESCDHYRTELLRNDNGWNVDIWTQCNHMPWSDIL